MHRSLFLILLFSSFYSNDLKSLQVNNLSCLENLTPGSKKQVRITLTNDRSVPEKLEFKLVDYACNSDGKHFFGETISEGASEKYWRSSKEWIQLGQNHITLDPGETRDVYYIIEVPESNSSELNGSYWNVLLIEPIDQELLKETTNEGFQLRIKLRYAHHTVVNIGEAIPKLKILKKEIKKIDDKQYLCIHVLNEGNLFFYPTLTFKLYDSDGKLEKTLKANPERLYPGNSQSFYLDLLDLSQERISKKLSGFILFDGENNLLFGDKFSYP